MVIRPAVPADALAVARVHVRVWQAGYQGLLPAAYLEALRAEDRAARYTFGAASGPATSVAAEGEAILGFATIMDDELSAFHVDPDAWNRGVGRALIAHARAEFVASGVHRAWLWLLAGNTRGQRFYERDGWFASGETRSDVVWGATVDEVRYVRELP
jgi:GNAT superfamily N-acetyltransferase